MGLNGTYMDLCGIYVVFMGFISDLYIYMDL